MKYFTKEIWAGYNTHDDSEFQKNMGMHEGNRREYFLQLEQLKPRLSKQTYRFFTTENLHDGRLLAFTASDDLSFNIDSSKRFDRNSRRTGVLMRVLNYEQDHLYTLKYTKVKRALFDFPTEDPLFDEEPDDISDWSFDELTAADEVYLRHEVLFSSGTTIAIEFKHFSYEKLRLPKK
jgi:hypothetical protein